LTVILLQGRRAKDSGRFKLFPPSASPLSACCHLLSGTLFMAVLRSTVHGCSERKTDVNFHRSFKVCDPLDSGSCHRFYACRWCLLVCSEPVKLLPEGLTSNVRNPAAVLAFLPALITLSQSVHALSLFLQLISVLQIKVCCCTIVDDFI
jgi:hypothetical protein